MFHKIKNKKIYSLTALLLTGTLAAGLFLYPQDVKAGERLSGVKSVVDEITGSNGTFKILEIVPDDADAEMGYLVSGSEFLDFDTELAKISGVSGRLDYVDTYYDIVKDTAGNVISKTFKAIASDVPGQAPLLYTSYVESYYPTAGYREITLTSPETATVNGSYVKVDDGTGEYTREVTPGEYSPVEAGTGNYIENVDHYTYGGTDWKLTFVYGADLTSGYVVSGTPSSFDKETWNASADSILVYTCTDGKYTYAGTIGSINTAATEEGWSVSYTDYYQVQFAYTTDAPKYEILSKEQTVNGEYTAVLDPEEPYIEVGINQGDYICTIQPVITYTPIADKKGNYNWVTAETGTTTNTIDISTIYITGGFTNQDWFKQHILDFGENELNSISVTVDTRTPAELTGINLSDYHLIYLGAGNSGYEAGNDLAVSHVVSLMETAVVNKTPVIVDNRILSAEELVTGVHTNAYAAAKILAASNTSAIYSEYMSNGTTVTSLAGAMTAATAFKEAEPADHHYVKDNIYLSDGLFATKDLITTLGSPTVAFADKDFETVLTLIQSENLYRESDGSGAYAPISTDISRATAIKYIINYQYQRVTLKTSLNVLDIEPCYSKGIDAQTVARWAGYESLAASPFGTDGIHVTLMTMAEFIGKTDDLNSRYDLIYFGAETDLLNKDSGGNPVYNDTAMNGLVYTGIGDIVMCGPQLSGLLSSDYITVGATQYVNAASTYRYSGNDMTQESEAKLETFLNADYPVVVSSKFYQTDGAVNKDVVDEHSYMHAFLQNAVTAERTNVINENLLSTDQQMVTSALFTYYLNRAKLQINMDSVSGTVDGSCYELSKSSDGKYYLTYGFSISNSGAISSDTKYSAKLYLDLNNDGKHSSKEILDNLTITDDYGNITNANELMVGSHYTITRQVPDGCDGLVPWKLEISQAEYNLNIRNEVEGYTKLMGREKENINILQIMPNNGTVLNMQNAYTGNPANASEGYFKEAMTGAEVESDFNITITSVTAEAYAAAYKTSSNYLNQFNLVIVGFADKFSDITDANSAVSGVDGLLEYVESGKSLLFSHDTTSYVNRPLSMHSYNGTSASDISGSYWGYTMNSYFRGVLGMDRYGVGSALPDTIYRPGSSPAATAQEIQGYTYSTLNGYRTGTETPLYNFDSAATSIENTVTDGDNTYITKVNEGQITSYPYDLPDTMAVADTHAQYYQLDLTADNDLDGQSDVTVWYCINGLDSKNRYGTDNQEDQYDVSPNDVVNNYFVYNKGNITYSGTGHTAIASSDEAELLVNTMIASFSAGLKQPVVRILENGNTAKEISSVYLYFDDAAGISTSEFPSTEKIYFQVSDTNFVEGSRTIQAGIYYANALGTTTLNIDGSSTTVSALSTVYDANGKVADLNSLASGAVYYFEIPVSYLNDKSTLPVYITGKTVITSTSGLGTATNETGTTTGVVTIRKVGLLLLD